jgi:hypothetical protein
MYVTTDISVPTDCISGLLSSMEIFPLIIRSNDATSYSTYVNFSLLQDIPTFISNISKVALIFLSRRIL